MSDPAMPLAPKLACRTVSLGAAWACKRHTNGAANAVAAVFRAVRRVIRDIGYSLGVDRCGDGAVTANPDRKGGGALRQGRGGETGTSCGYRVRGRVRVPTPLPTGSVEPRSTR